MGVYVETEYRGKRAKESDPSPKPGISSRQSHASRSAFNHNVKTGGKPQNAMFKPSKEVTVKLTGAGKTAKGIKSGIDYITRDGELEAFWNDGCGFEDTAKGSDYCREMTSSLTDGNDYGKQYRGENINHVRNMVFSPPPEAKVSREDAIKATSEFLKEKYPNHAFIAVYHDDKEKHPHVHVNFKLRNEDTGKRLDFNKAELRSLRDCFSQKLLDQGYDVIATHKNDPARRREIERLQGENRPRMRNTYKVISFGETEYQNKPGGKRTPFITYETLKGGKQVTIWGKDLKNHFEKEKLREGSLIKIKKSEPTLVRSPMFNEDGSISGYKETKRNNWQIENMGVDRQRTLETAKVQTLERDDRSVRKQLERKRDRQHNIEFAVEKGFVRDSPEHKKLNSEQARSWKGLGF